jgi:hypothetical protein
VRGGLQGVVAPLTVVAALSTLATALLNHLFIFQLGLGMIGAAVAYNLLQVRGAAAARMRSRRRRRQGPCESMLR